MSDRRILGFVALLAIGATMARTPAPSDARSAPEAMDPASSQSGAAVAQDAGPAPGGPGRKADWTEADKTGFGTSRTRGSNVWFTLHRGRMSEAYYPNLSTPSVRTLELVVTDGRTFTDRESTD